MKGMWLLASALLPVLIQPAMCRQHPSGTARWQSDGRGTMSISTEARFVGEVTMTCKVRLDKGITKVLLEFEHAEVSFQPAASRTPGAGIVIEAEGQRFEILRVAHEDWIQSTNRSLVVPVREGAREIQILIRLLDTSAELPIRADLRRLRLTSEPAK